MKRSACQGLLAGLLAGWLAGCVHVPPRDPPAPVLPARALLAADAAATAGWPAAQWWHAFGDPTLDALVSQALASSPDMAVVDARVAAARTGIDLARSAFGPGAAFGAEAQRVRLSDNGLFPPRLLGFNWYNQFELGVSATWSPDWWGQHRAELAAALDSTQALEAERAAASLALATSVVESWVGWQSDSARLALARERVANGERVLALLQARLQARIDRSDASARAQLELLALRQHVNELETSLALRRVTLAALVGVAPEALPVLGARALPEPPAGLPAGATLDLMARRPDLVAARWRIEAGARQRDVARTRFLPDISFNALLALSSRDLGKLLEVGSGAPTASAAIHLPLFESGSLKAAYARSQAELDQSVASYRSILLAAAREVNAQLVARAGWLAESETRRAQLAVASTLRATASARAGQGLSDLQPELAATEQWLALREAQELTRHARLGSELELIRALGGGYRMDEVK